MVKLFKIGLLLLLSLGMTACATQDLRPVLKNTPQNALVYLNLQTENRLLLSNAAQQQAVHNYLRHYFSPWTDQRQVLTQAEKNYIQKFSQANYWTENQHPVSAVWIKNIADNMALISFPNHLAKAITIDTTSLRVLPTKAPLFDGKDDYPFDELQQSLIPANTPILIIQTSADKAWDLVLAPYTEGWLPAQDIAYVNNNFIKRWQTKKYIVSVKDKISLISTDKKFAYVDRIGNLHPIYKNKILIAVVNSNRQAVIKTVAVNKNNVTNFPLAATPKNIATLANQMLGDAYEWGGMYGGRDCSATMQDLFATVGIWLPRNSHDQAATGKVIELAGLSSTQKENIIRAKAIPFFTLLGLPGHIMLYIGERNGKLYVFHDTWGLHTWNDGRAVIGGTVITPIRLGEGYINVKASLLQRVTSLAIL
jgi:cell wall-associated NlpC family hydrolase